MVFDPKPAVVGHRGLGCGVVDGVAENTIESYRAAVARGLRWVEVDVRRAGDGDLIVHHDSATPDGHFFIDHPGSACAARGVARFADVLDAIPPEIAINVDVKTEFEDAVDAADRRTGALLVPVLAREARRRQVFVSSFDPALLLYLKERVPAIALGLITWVRFPLPIAVSAAANLGMDVLCVDVRSFDLDGRGQGPARRPPEYAIDIAHKAGLEVLVWCPGPCEARWFAEAGADALCVNDVDGVLSVLRHPQ